MKKLLFLCLIACASGFAQDSVTKPAKRVKPIYKMHSIGVAKVYAGYPIAIGENLLSKSYTGLYSYNIEFSFLEIYGVNFGVGGGSSGYKSKNDVYANDFENAQFITLYPTLWKRLKISEKWNICPEAGVGLAVLMERTPGERDQLQETTLLRAGVIGNYKLNYYFSLNMGVTFQYADFQVDTAAELQDYYSDVRQFQIQFGLHFDFTRKRYKAIYN